RLKRRALNARSKSAVSVRRGWPPLPGAPRPLPTTGPRAGAAPGAAAASPAPMAAPPASAASPAPAAEAPAGSVAAPGPSQAGEFALLDEALKARHQAGLT